MTYSLLVEIRGEYSRCYIRPSPIIHLLDPFHQSQSPEEPQLANQNHVCVHFLGQAKKKGSRSRAEYSQWIEHGKEPTSLFGSIQ